MAESLPNYSNDGFMVVELNSENLPHVNLPEHHNQRTRELNNLYLAQTRPPYPYKQEGHSTEKRVQVQDKHPVPKQAQQLFSTFAGMINLKLIVPDRQGTQQVRANLHT
jgi:hypothetical protein